MANRPISQLVDDISDFIEKGRAAAGPKVVVKLQEQGPWWTGDFGRRWQVSATPVKPVELPENMVRSPIPQREQRPTFFNELPVLTVPINSPLYIGNSVSYAGFAVGRPGSRLYRPLDQRGDTGKEMVNYKEHQTDGRRLTSLNQRPDWYDVYTRSENGGLLDTLDEAFQQALQRML